MITTYLKKYFHGLTVDDAPECQLHYQLHRLRNSPSGVNIERQEFCSAIEKPRHLITLMILKHGLLGSYQAKHCDVSTNVRLTGMQLAPGSSFI